MSLPRQLLNHSIIWLVLPVVVILALYVSIGRYFFPLLENYRDDLVSFANRELAINLQIEQLAGQWNDFDPYIQLDAIQVYAPQVTSVAQGILPAIEVEHFSLELDSLSSFRYRFPVIRQASIEGVTLRLKQGDDNRWLLNGWQPGDKDSPASRRSRSQLKRDVAPIAGLLDFLLRQQHLKLEQVWLQLEDRMGRRYRAYSSLLEVYETDGRQRLQGSLQLDPTAPEQIAFMMEISGDPFEPESLEVDLYLQADSQSLTSWVEKVGHLLPFELNRLEGGVQLWSRWQGGALQSLKGMVEQGQLALTLPDQPQIELQDFNSVLFMERQADGWELIADQLSFNLQQQMFDLQQLRFVQGAGSFLLQLEQLDLPRVTAALMSWPDLPERAQDALKRLQPQGVLHQVQVEQKSGQAPEFSARLQNVGVDAFYGAPVLRNVNGYLQSSAREGFIRFHSDRFYMGYPRLYSDGWWFDKAQGEVHWQIGDSLRVFGLGLQINQGPTQVAGEFDLHQYRDADDTFYLNVGLTEAEEALGLTLIPDLILPPDLVSWIRGAVRQAQVRKGGFIYDGTLNLSSPNPARQISTLLMLDVAGGALKFLPDWPVADQLDAEVLLDGSELDVAVRNGRFLQNEGVRGEVTLRHDGTGNRVGLNLNAGLIPEWGWQVFTATPLKNLVPESLHQWQLSGAPLALETDLSFPVDGRPGQGQVRVRADNNRLLIPEVGTPVEQLNADVVYDIEQGLSSDSATAQLLGGPVQFDIRTDLSRKAVQIEGTGRGDLQTVGQWQPLPFSSWLTGEFDYRVLVDLDRYSTLHLESDLTGVNVLLPEPIGKGAATARPLELDMHFSAQGNGFNVAYGAPGAPGHLVSAGIWGGAPGGYGVKVWYGDALQDVEPVTQASNRTDIYYRMPQIDLEPWLAFAEEEQARRALSDSVARGIAEASPDTVSGAADAGVARLHLTTPRLFYRQIQVDDLTVDAQISGAGVEARLVSQQLEGEVELADSGIRLDMKRVFLDQQSLAADDAAAETAAPADAPDTTEAEVALSDDQARQLKLAPLFRNAWPDADLKVAEFQILGISGQKLDLQYRSDRQSRQLKLNNLNQKSASFNGTLDWLIPDTLQPGRSSLVFHVKGGDLGDVQDAFGVPVALTSRKANTRMRLNWQGMPHEFESSTLNGQVVLDLEKGRFEQVQYVSALKLLSLVNFESLVRRLQLDFSDLSGKGLSYDKVSGVIDLDQGIGTLSQPIRVEGTATKFEMSGKIDFVDEQFDQEMVVTIPVGETLPFAAILAGAPQVGGTIYIIQKVFGNLFDKITRATYTIRGDWGEPHIELKRVF